MHSRQTGYVHCFVSTTLHLPLLLFFESAMDLRFMASPTICRWRCSQLQRVVEIHTVANFSKTRVKKTLCLISDNTRLYYVFPISSNDEERSTPLDKHCSTLLTGTGVSVVVHCIATTDSDSKNSITTDGNLWLRINPLQTKQHRNDCWFMRHLFRSNFAYLLLIEAQYENLLKLNYETAGYV